MFQGYWFNGFTTLSTKTMQNIVFVQKKYIQQKKRVCHQFDTPSSIELQFHISTKFLSKYIIGLAFTNNEHLTNKISKEHPH